MKFSDFDYIKRVKSFSANAKLFLIFVFLTSLSLGVYQVIFNLYIIELGFSERFLGIILALTALGTALFSFPSAILCDRIGRKNTLLLSCAFSVFSMIPMYMVENHLILIISCTLYGGTTALGVVTGSTFMLENSRPYERLHLFSVYQLLITIAIMFGSFAGGFLPHVLNLLLNIETFGAISYRITLILSVICTIFAVIPIKKINEEKTYKNVLEKGEIKNILKSYSKALKKKK
ncbi:MAG: MFS transporter [Methanosarcinaceae archaeon]|nr:MFS transporter [Methanosarcinaceae archaeon]